MDNLGNFFTKITNFFRYGNKSKIIGLMVLAILLVGIPLSVLSVLEQQDVRQRAAEPNQEIAIAQQKLTIAQQKVDQAQRGVKQAQQELNQAQNDVDQAQQELAQADTPQKRENARDRIDRAQTRRNQARSSVDRAQQDLNKAQTELNQAKKALEAAQQSGQGNVPTLTPTSIPGVTITLTPAPTSGVTTGRSITCSLTSITLTTQEQTLTATFKNAKGETPKDKTILWRSSLSDNQINISNPSPNTNANGVVTTKVKAKTQTAVGKAGTVTAVFDNDRNVKCTIALLAAGTDTPTPTEELGNIKNAEVRFDFTVFLHGIGKGGDNVSAASAGNNNPRKQTRPITVKIIKNSDRSVVKNSDIPFTYDPVTGAYKTTKDFTNIPQGRYIFRIKASNFLEEITQVPVEVKHGQKTTVSPVYLQAGDPNNDNFRNILDFTIMADCIEVIAAPRACDDADKKEKADLDDSQTVDLIDYNLFIRELSNVSRTATNNAP